MMRYFKTTILFFFIIASFLGCSQSVRTHTYKNLSAKEFYDFLSAKKNNVLVDVRTKQEYKDCHIQNSYLASNSKRLFAIADTLDLDQNIFVYCESGGRSPRACKLLVDKGFVHVFNLKNGLIEWMISGYKTDTTKIKSY